MNLYEYQQQTVNYGIKNFYCILALEVGLGKTICALTIGVQTESKMLIICPAYLRFTWLNEIKKWFPHLKAEIYSTKKHIKRPIDLDVVIVSYGIIEHCECLFEWADLVIADEAHNLKSMQAKRTEAFHRLVYENNIKRLLLLTGTPILNRVYEFYSLIALCNYNPKCQGSNFLKRFKSYVVFADHFSHRREFQMMVKNRRIKVVNWDGFKNVEELKTILNGIYIKFKAKDVLQDLPDKIYKDVLINNSEDKELLEAFELMQSQDGMDRVQPTIKALNALSKVPFTIEYVKDLLEGGVKVLVYSDHREAAKALAIGLGVKAITGAMPTTERQALADSFQNGPSNVLVATIGSFSTGITLTAANQMVINDVSWSPGCMSQMEGRIHRVGQPHPCIYHYIFGSFTDKYIWQKLSDKKEIIEKAT